MCGLQWGVPQAIGAVTQAGDYYLVLFSYFHIKFGEDGDAVVIANFSRGDEGAFGDVVEDVGELRFGRDFFWQFQGGS